MYDKNDLYNFLYNPEEYDKQKEYNRKKKILYGNELRLQIEENNKIKNQLNGAEFPTITNNNNNYDYNKDYN